MHCAWCTCIVLYCILAKAPQPGPAADVMYAFFRGDDGQMSVLNASDVSARVSNGWTYDIRNAVVVAEHLG
ncbi:hypothetical protein PR003_g19986 [Phytophthora rubi]|uniref:Pectate lyase n=2 Tax=Phytophthora TaxID=4783 RepID=A0A6G0RMQ1_9STRA|nr:hypothetical protein PR002_g23646 [Phytophthora rubi]KAE8984796.1 hypothetical protein PR001_g23070 [Phytophthora rubi]KAE9238961.1 hypothetical protein PF004_g8182 [Phytophthora fragariae]KAE9311516.1 hypothetical protein PR003_g19986 [Phytophthora rubi]KAE9337514.1 hypothetical protein PF008_g12502 [Phytophthora fragariae]